MREEWLQHGVATPIPMEIGLVNIKLQTCRFCPSLSDSLVKGKFETKPAQLLTLAASFGYCETCSSFRIEDVMEVVMRRHLIALTIGWAALLTGSNGEHQVTRAQQPPAVEAGTAQEMVPFHCQAPAHAARFFAGSFGVAIGLGTDRHPQICLLLRVPPAGNSDHAKF